MITLVTILGFINVFVLLYRIDYGLYLFTVLIPFTSLLPATGIPGLNMTSFIIILLFIKSYSENKNEVPVNKEVSNLTRVIFILLIWCILSIILSRLVYTHQTLPLISYFEKLYRWFIFIFLYFVYKRELTTKEKVYYALFALSIGVLAEAAYVVKALMLSGRLRTYGTIGQSNELALFFGCYLLIQVLFFLHVKKLIYKLFFLASIFLSLTGVASTLSRGGLLVVLVSFLGLLLFKYKLKGVVILIIGLSFSGTLYSFLPDKVTNRIDETFVDDSEAGREIGEIRVERSAYSRIPLAKAGLEMFIDSPIWGQGFMSYPLLVPQYKYGGQYGINRTKASHNMHVRMLSELGIIGYLLFLKIFSNSIKVGLRLNKDKSFDSRDRDLGSILCLISIGFLVGCLFGDRFFRGTLISYYFIISAACYNIYLMNKADPIKNRIFDK